MKIEHLKEFVVLAEILNYRKASAVLYITQPTLTKHIQELERELGVALFDRDERGVTLTDDGKILETKARYLLDVYRDLLSSVRKNNVEVAVPLRYSLFSGLIAAARSELPHLRPDIECNVRDFHLDCAPADLLNDGCDLVLNVYLPAYEDGIASGTTLAPAQLSAWVSKDGALANKNVISAHDLQGMVFRPPSSKKDYPWSPFVVSLFDKLGVSFQIGIALDDQYQLGPLDFGLVFGGEPTAMLGFNAKQVRITEPILVHVAAYRRKNDANAALDDLVGVLKRLAPQFFSPVQ